MKMQIICIFKCGFFLSFFGIMVNNEKEEEIHNRGREKEKRKKK